MLVTISFALDYQYRSPRSAHRKSHSSTGCCSEAGASGAPASGELRHHPNRRRGSDARNGFYPGGASKVRERPPGSGMIRCAVLLGGPGVLVSPRGCAPGLGFVSWTSMIPTAGMTSRHRDGTRGRFSRSNRRHVAKMSPLARRRIPANPSFRRRSRVNLLQFSKVQIGGRLAARRLRGM
jgi:hypothetical protein